MSGKFKSTLVCQEESIELLEKVIDDPPHIFLSGGYGSGKTTLMNEFISAYFVLKGLTPPPRESILWLSSEQDRGIHCVRQSVAEFVRHTSATPGIYRWIVVDDADSLPIISQQALRRPMETHSHTTRFLFCSRYSSDLIQPLKSRCMHVELDSITPTILVKYFLEKQGSSHITFSPNAFAVFMSVASTPTEIRNITHIIARHYPSNTPYEINAHDILALFSAPSFSLCLNLLKAYIMKKNDEMIRIFIELWSTGISYEDFLHELNSSMFMLGIIPAKTSQKIHQLLLRGWICFAQGKTHSLDMMRLFLDLAHQGT
jgi:hypothetical protein